MFTKKRKTILIYAGSYPVPPFIQNLIQVVSLRHKTIVLGRGTYTGPERNIRVRFIPRGRLERSASLCLNTMLLLVTQPRRLWAVLVLLRDYEGYEKRYRASLWLPVIRARPDIVHIQWAGHLEYFEPLLDGLGIRFVVSLRGRHINVLPHTDEAVRQRFQRTFPAIAAFHAVSEAVVAEVVGLGARRERVFVARSAVVLPVGSTDDVNVRSGTAIPRIISVGRDDWKKGYRYGLDAIKRLHEVGIKVTYQIVGSGRSDALVHQIQDLGLDRWVTLLESVSHAEVMLRMQSADLVLLPSVEEGIANVVLEAMAVGIPVVTSDCGGMAEVISDGVNGFLFTSRDVSGMAETIKRALGMSVEDRARLIRRAKETVRSGYNLDSLQSGIEAAYRAAEEPS